MKSLHNPGSKLKEAFSDKQGRCVCGLANSYPMKFSGLTAARRGSALFTFKFNGVVAES